MSTKFESAFVFSFLYLLLGALLQFGLEVFSIISPETVAESIAVILFWPVFVIKYLAIGIWAVLVGFISLI